MNNRYILFVQSDKKKKGTSSLLYKEVVNTLVEKNKEFHYRMVNGVNGRSVAFIVLWESSRWDLHYALDIPLEDFQLFTTDVPLFSWK